MNLVMRKGFFYTRDDHIPSLHIPYNSKNGASQSAGFIPEKSCQTKALVLGADFRKC